MASPIALRGSDPVSKPGIKAFKGHLIKWLNAAKWTREKSVLRLMILEAPKCCAGSEVGRRVGRVEPVSPVIAPSPVARDLSAPGQESAERTTITLEVPG